MKNILLKTKQNKTKEHIIEIGDNRDKGLVPKLF